MTKKKKKATNKSNVASPLNLHNIANYIEDLSIISQFCFLSKSRRDWIEINRYLLQEKANIYEHRLGETLLKNKIHFIHQAPFVINNKIYFLDFFLPEKRLAIEVDGSYHKSEIMINNDRDRDFNFKSIGIKTVRIGNTEVMSERILDTRLKLANII